MSDKQRAETAGEWVVDEGDTGESVGIWGGEGSHDLIASVPHSGIVSSRTKDEALAIAHTMAASRRMLAACEQVIDDIVNVCGPTIATIEQVELAVAAARNTL